MADEEMMEPDAAAALLQQSRERAHDALAVKQSRLYAAWGIAWLIGLGAMWLSVRGQHPYRGPSGAAVAILAVLIAVAIAVTMLWVGQATRGVGGVSARQGAMYGLTWAVGFAALFVIEGALSHTGASAKVMGVTYTVGPLLVTGLIYMMAAAIWLDRVMFAFGIWLLAVAAAGAWTGPVGVLLAGALAGGGGFLVVAAIKAWRACT